MPASNMSVQPAGYDMNSGKVIDNDFHPDDQGLEADDDHWGTVTEPKMSDTSYGNNMLSNMGSRSALGMASKAKKNSTDYTK